MYERIYRPVKLKSVVHFSEIFTGSPCGDPAVQGRGNSELNKAVFRESRGCEI
jgi:hypothetical protein